MRSPASQMVVLGFLALRQCQYTSALQRFQQARQTFSELQMEKDVIQMDMEIADAYLDLNLLREAAEAYEQATTAFAELGMTYEAGRAADVGERLRVVEAHLAEHGRVHAPGIAAPVQFADPPTGQNHLVAGLELGRRRFLDGAGEIDAGDMRILPHQPPLPEQDHAVLVVQRRILDPYGHLALRQARVVEIFEARHDRAVFLVQHQGAEGAHTDTSIRRSLRAQRSNPGLFPRKPSGLLRRCAPRNDG